MGSTQHVTAKLPSTTPPTPTRRRIHTTSVSSSAPYPQYHLIQPVRNIQTKKIHQINGLYCIHNLNHSHTKKTPIRVKEQFRRHPAVTQSNGSYGSRQIRAAKLKGSVF
uniref:Uncharacterized protein n=1 Tax=Cucumis melo TaxID=3656 RepID=A0A9I9CF89_CUCME